MKIITKIIENKEHIATSAIILICLLLYALFPTDGIFQKIVSAITFLLVIPALYIKLILKRAFSAYGIRLGDKKTGFFMMTLSLVISLLLFYALFKYTSLPQQHNLPGLVTKNFVFFILYEVFLVGLFAVVNELFFRSFVIFSFSKLLGLWVVVLQLFLFVGFYFVLGAKDWTILLFMIISPFAGLVAYKSRSVIYSFGTSLIFIVIADVLAIGLLKK
jgi:hypothetical protein